MLNSLFLTLNVTIEISRVSLRVRVKIWAKIEGEGEGEIEAVGERNLKFICIIKKVVESKIMN